MLSVAVVLLALLTIIVVAVVDDEQHSLVFVRELLVGMLSHLG